ncbi:FAD-dependent oxidoreductase [Amycolatopsis antarctica]|uniref:FAD-dependent oxidoreductase n=1 Tax=Amycolatopsis antarctica TaxID=1854586 RepID=A0A263D4S2_9PSEU|nr:NAD(P)/FAD-dependent oxidoreductase [Amycolatopsis antarctica]OZM73048.1 FAD-dependent oxidoreductase [Amycolatopsis antarctica]
MFDVVVVGARCGGAPAAMLLARAGHRVLLLDRSRALGDTLSTLYIQPAGVRLLDQWGLLGELAATGCPPITHRTFGIGEVTLAGAAETAYAPRRRILDQALAGAAVGAGAEFRPGWAVRDVLRDGDRVTGVRCRTPDGDRDVRARLVVGADGVRSRVARATGARTQVEHPVLTCAYYTYWSGVPAQFETYSGPGRAVGCFPTHADQTLVVTYFPHEAFARVREDPMEAYLANVRATAPDLFRRMCAGRQRDRLYGTGWQPNYLRRAAGPGWALVGDAGHHKDSITAQGITDAFHQARILAGCVGRDVSDEDGLDAALDGYAAARDALAERNFPTTLHLASLEVPEDLDRLRALAADPAATAQVLAAFGGSYPDDVADLVPASTLAG